MKEAQELFQKLFIYDEDLLVSTRVYEKLERKISAIKAELITYHRRDDKEDSAWFTIELIEKILNEDYFTDIATKVDEK